MTIKQQESLHLTCGCEPGWRCKDHAELVRKNKPNRHSESVVMRVYATTSYNDEWHNRFVPRKQDRNRSSN